MLWCGVRQCVAVALCMIHPDKQVKAGQHNTAERNRERGKYALTHSRTQLPLSIVFVIG